MTLPRPTSSGRLDPARASPTPAALAADLTQRFDLGPALGQGGFGTVHRARERATGREVALKLLRREGSAAAFERFLREAAVAAALEHPGIVKVHAVGVHGGRPCIVYELIDGAPLDHAARTLDHRRRTELVRDAARAVGHAHARGVIHRDLKPDNILVDADGRVHVADFGLATIEGADRITQTGAALGTPTHMAPEQFQGRTSETPGPAVDVWSLGVVLYELLTGRLPFEGPSLVALAAEVDAARPTPPRRIDPSIAPAVEAVILRAFSRDPEHRYRDAEALAEALDEALARPAGARRRLLLAPAVVALALGLAGAAFVLHPSGGAPAREASSPAGVEAEPPAGRAPVAVAPGSVEPIAPPGAPRRLGPHSLAVASPEAPRWAVALAGGRVLTGGPADQVRLWNASTGEELCAWPELRGALAARRTVGAVLVCLADRVCRLELDAGRSAQGRHVDRPAARLLLMTARAPGDAPYLTCAHAAPVAALLADDGSWGLVFDTATGATLLEVPPGRFAGAALSPSGQALLVCEVKDEVSPGLGGAALVYYRVPSPMPAVPDLRLPMAGVAHQICFDPLGRRFYVGTSLRHVATASVDQVELGHFTIGDAATSHASEILAMAVTPDGDTLLSAAWLDDDASEVQPWNATTRAPGRPADHLPGEVRTLDVSPDGRFYVAATRRGAVHVRPVWPDRGR